MSTTETVTVSVQSTSQAISISGYDSETGNTEIIINTSFPANTNASNTNASGLTLNFNSAGIQNVFFVADKGCTIFGNGVNTADVQTVTETVGTNGGAFDLNYNGAVTNTLAYNSNAATVQTALQALATIGSGNMNCTGGPLPTNGIICTFAGALNTGVRPTMIAGQGSLTNGSVAVAHTTPGQPSWTLTLPPGIPYQWGASQGFYGCLLNSNTNAAYVQCNAAVRLQGRILTS